MSNPMTLFKKNQTVEIEIINRIYGGPLLRLVHHRHHLGLNLTVRI